MRRRYNIAALLLTSTLIINSFVLPVLADETEAVSDASETTVIMPPTDGSFSPDVVSPAEPADILSDAIDSGMNTVSEEPSDIETIIEDPEEQADPTTIADQEVQEESAPVTEQTVKTDSAQAADQSENEVSVVITSVPVEALSLEDEIADAEITADEAHEEKSEADISETADTIQLEENVEMETYDAGLKPSSLMLGIFFTSEKDQSDTLFVSFNGRDFYKLGYAFEDGNKGSSSDNEIVDKPWNGINCLHDPALQYAQGGYWTMSGFQMGSGSGRMFIPMISYSSDLVNWSYPASGSSTNVKPSVLPLGKDGKHNNSDFDCVAPELFFDDNGDAYIVVCMGYYSSWHGDSELNAKMSPYLIKANGLKPGSYSPSTVSEKGKPPIVSYSSAIPINLPDHCNERIDGHLFKESGKYYLSIKRNGVTNEIWSINSLNNVSNKDAWTRVRDIVTVGYEGPSLTKYAGKYYMYSDGLASHPDVKTTGIFVSTSSSISGKWTKNTPVNFYVDKNGKKTQQRHGTVITITDPAQINKIMELYNKQGYKAYTASMSNPFTGSSPQSFNGVFVREKGIDYWYENDKRQAVEGDPKNIIDSVYNTERGREIYDPKTDAWYWLDSIYDEAKAIGKEVWMPYIYQNEAGWSDSDIKYIANESDAGMAQCVYDAIKNKSGKWVRYDENGHMLKGWITIEGELATHYPAQAGNTYYYDTRTGLMAKGYVVIDGQRHYFDPVSGALVE